MLSTAGHVLSQSCDIPVFKQIIACWSFTVRSRVSGEPSAAELLRTGFQKAFHHLPQAGGHREGMLRSWRLVIHKIWFYVLYESPKNLPALWGLKIQKHPDIHISPKTSHRTREKPGFKPLCLKKNDYCSQPNSLTHTWYVRGFPKVQNNFMLWRC